jgi:PAS domain S-box-containing protein
LEQVSVGRSAKYGGWRSSALPLFRIARDPVPDEFMVEPARRRQVQFEDRMKLAGSGSPESTSMTAPTPDNSRLGLAISLPFVALALQWLLWAWLSPFVWFLFFPTVFFSARLGGLRGGLISTVLATALVWYFFIPPQLSWAIDKPSNFYSVALFLVMGWLLSENQERLRQARFESETALAQTRAANEKVVALYRRTLELDELKSQFFANISHELRTPLTLIMSPLTRRLATTDLGAAVRSEDEMILRNAQLLYRHVSDLLDVVKLESGRMTVHRTRIELGTLLRACASPFESLARDRSLDFQIDVAVAVTADVDSEKVQRIVLNLLSNAFKFGAKSVVLRLRTVSGDAVIEVQDDGPGVPAAQREAVFERFAQVDGDARRRFGGTGLGLAIVKEFAVLHGGSAAITDAPGGGALVTVRLRLHAESTAEVASQASQIDPLLESQMIQELRPRADVAELALATPTESAAADPALVLVVEDNLDMNAFIANSLRPRYQVVCAFDGREGLTQAIALHPDLIICDLMMPGLSGDELLVELRRHSACDDVAVVILTARAQDDLRVSLIDSGAQDVLFKPFAVDELLARVGSLIGQRQRVRAELQRFEQIVATTGDLLAFVDRDRRYAVVNPAYARLFGLGAADLTQSSVAEIVGEENLHHIGPRLDRAFAGEAQRFRFRPLLPDGSRPVLDAEYRPYVRDGKVQGVVISARDVTEAQLAEKALAMSEERLRLALDATRDGLWDWDLVSDQAYLSPHYYEMTGYRSDEVTPNLDFFNSTIHPEDRERVMATMNAHLQGTSPVSEFDYRLVTGSGQIKWMRGKGQVVKRDDKGLPLRAIGTISDISERKIAEDSMRRQTEELATRNAELERFNRATVGRELDMIALKQQINALSRQLGAEPPYAIAFVDPVEAVADGAGE